MPAIGKIQRAWNPYKDDSHYQMVGKPTLVKHGGRIYSRVTYQRKHAFDNWHIVHSVAAFFATVFSFGLALTLKKIINWWKGIEVKQIDLIAMDKMLESDDLETYLREIEQVTKDLGFPLKFQSNKIFDQLIKLAKWMGYTPSGLVKNLEELEKYYQYNGLTEVSRLLLTQIISYKIQARALRKIFERMDVQELTKAVIEQEKFRQHKDLYEGEKTNITIVDKKLVGTFFKNLRGDLEFILVFSMHNSPSGAYKVYSKAGTVASIQDIAHLELKKEDRNKKSQKKLEREGKIWMELQELCIPHIPKLYSYKKMEKNFILFAENFHSDLWKVIPSHGSEKLFHQIAEPLFEFLVNLHKNQYIHRDIKPRNILIRKEKKTGKIEKIAVTDFGCTKRIESEDVPIKGRTGTPGYKAPEVETEKKSFQKSDVWSAACTLLKVRYGKRFSPFVYCDRRYKRDFEEEEHIKDYFKWWIKKVAGRAPDPYDQWLKKCLTYKVEDRLSSEQAYSLYRFSSL